MTKAARNQVSPVPIMQDLWAGCRTETLVAALELDLFTHIAAGNDRVTTIAEAAQVSSRGVERLLDALVSLKYLAKSSGRYSLTPIADTFLVRGRDLYFAGAVLYASGMNRQWSKLAEVVRTGRPIFDAKREELAREFFPLLVRLLFADNHPAARMVPRALSRNALHGIRRILDVAGGSGAWSIAFAEVLPSVRVTLLDFPEVTVVCRSFAERYGVADRYDYIEGNLYREDWGVGEYDLVILGHILHSEGEEQAAELIDRAGRALTERGMLLIAEMVPNDRRTGPEFPLLFGLNMLIATPAGGVFTMRQYRKWLRAAGFRNIRKLPAPAPSPLILASRRKK